MVKANADIRQAIKESGFRHWEVADAFGICADTLCKKLRKELPTEEKKKILEKIREMQQ